MTQTLAITLFLTIALLACSSNEIKGTIDDFLENTPIATDTSKPVIADSYPITDELLASNSPDRRRMKVGEVESLDRVWFRNDSLKQTLVVELYTDGFRYIISHFLDTDVPDEFIDGMELHLEDGMTASLAQKKVAFPELVEKAAKISSQYFTSAKGFKLGIDKQKLLATYGAPFTETSGNRLEILEWRYAGDQITEVEEALKIQAARKR